MAPAKTANEFDRSWTALLLRRDGRTGWRYRRTCPAPTGRKWTLQITNTQKTGDVFIHRASLTLGPRSRSGRGRPRVGGCARRNAIQRHHTVTHLLHWALHEVVSKEASQKGSFVGPDKLTFDFNTAAHARAGARHREARQRAHRRERGVSVDGSPLRRRRGRQPT